MSCIKLLRHSLFPPALRQFSSALTSSPTTPRLADIDDGDDDDFRVDKKVIMKERLDRAGDPLGERRRGTSHRRRRLPSLPPRYQRMAVDQRWADVWPAPATFKASAVPFPVHQGFADRPSVLPPPRHANLELMKPPNFLHLSPPAVAAHCRALAARFTTAWPAALATDSLCQRHFPLEVVTSDYCYSANTIRNPLARVVTVRCRLSSLRLDYHARDKLRRLAGHRYDAATDTLTILADRCPLRQQNLDHASYLLTALYMEAWRREAWESGKVVRDWERYVWHLHPSRAAARRIVKHVRRLVRGGETNNLPAYAQRVREMLGDDVWGKAGYGAREMRDKVRDEVDKLGDEMRDVGDEVGDEVGDKVQEMFDKVGDKVGDKVDELDEVKAVRDAVNALHHQGESQQTLAAYKQATLDLLGLQPYTIDSVEQE